MCKKWCTIINARKCKNRRVTTVIEIGAPSRKVVYEYYRGWTADAADPAESKPMLARFGLRLNLAWAQSLLAGCRLLTQTQVQTAKPSFRLKGSRTQTQRLRLKHCARGGCLNYVSLLDFRLVPTKVMLWVTCPLAPETDF